MTFVALETESPAFEIAKRIIRCDCPMTTPVCLDLLGCRMFDLEDSDQEILIHCYCTRCRRRDEVMMYQKQMPYISMNAFQQIASHMSCTHTNAFEISPWCIIRQWRVRDSETKLVYWHLVYCRTCRRVTRVGLRKVDAIR